MGEVIEFPTRYHQEADLALAAGAEAFVPYAVYPDSHETLSDTLEAATEFMAMNADTTPWLRGERQQARTHACETVEYRRQQLVDGYFDDALLDVDALGTAVKVAAIGEKYGKKSEQYREAREELVLDCERKLAEAYRKNSWEYFEPTTQQYNPETDQLYTGGLSVDHMVENGLTPLAETEEIKRRINDKVRLQTHKAIVKHPASKDMAAVHVSPCTQWAIDAYNKNARGAHGGYAPEIKKQMFNYDGFESNEIRHEQFGVSGLYITDDVVVETFQVIGVIQSGQKLDKNAIHDVTGIVSSRQIKGVVDIVRIADQIASEKSGKNIFLGEVVTADHLKNYDTVYEEAAARKQQRQGQAEELALYVEELYEQEIDHALATVMVEKYLQDKLLKVAEADPDQAEIIFNKETADGFREVQALEAQGRYQEAGNRRAQVEEAAPQAGSCGAGSCGLESVDKESSEGKELVKKLKAKPKDSLVKDTVRACKCGRKSIVYAYSNNKVNKYCQSCEAFESKTTN